jgi:heterodisulfide reductase subunit B
MKTIGYYPGCSLKGSSREYDESLRAMAGIIGLNLVEVPDWNCCGASSAHNLNKKLSLALPARILALAEQAGLNEIVAPCAACSNRLSVARHELLVDGGLRKEISADINMEYKGSAKVVNIIEALQPMIPEIKAKMKKSFNFKVACYYGCLLVRPQKILKFDRYDDPDSMDAIMREIGATPIDWSHKVECCGAAYSISNPDIVGKLSRKIVEDAVNRGAQAIIVACPLCHANLDLRRNYIEKHAGKKYSIPVIYITQAIGMALGIDNKKLGLQRHTVRVKLPGLDDYEQNSNETEKVEECHA